MEENKKPKAIKDMTLSELRVHAENLNNYLNQAYMRIRELTQRLNSVMNVQNKLPFMFEVLKNREFFDDEYINATVLEITKIMPPYKETEPEKETEETTED